jgi:glutamyl-tRNA synthetase
VVAGTHESVVDDFVLQRNDGVPAYNLAVVVDDVAQGVTQVVRADDLLFSTGRQMHLLNLLGHETPQHAHVPLVVGPDGERLAKRHGAVTLDDLALRGVTPVDVLRVLATSLGIEVAGVERALDLVDRFRPSALPRTSWMIPDEWSHDAP